MPKSKPIKHALQIPKTTPYDVVKVPEKLNAEDNTLTILLRILANEDTTVELVANTSISGMQLKITGSSVTSIFGVKSILLKLIFSTRTPASSSIFSSFLPREDTKIKVFKPASRLIDNKHKKCIIISSKQVLNEASLQHKVSVESTIATFAESAPDLFYNMTICPSILGSQSNPLTLENRELLRLQLLGKLIEHDAGNDSASISFFFMDPQHDVSIVIMKFLENSVTMHRYLSKTFSPGISIKLEDKLDAFYNVVISHFRLFLMGFAHKDAHYGNNMIAPDGSTQIIDFGDVVGLQDTPDKTFIRNRIPNQDVDNGFLRQLHALPIRDQFDRFFPYLERLKFYRHYRESGDNFIIDAFNTYERDFLNPEYLKDEILTTIQNQYGKSVKESSERGTTVFQYLDKFKQFVKGGKKTTLGKKHKHRKRNTKRSVKL